MMLALMQSIADIFDITQSRFSTIPDLETRGRALRFAPGNAEGQGHDSPGRHAQGF